MGSNLTKIDIRFLVFFSRKNGVDDKKIEKTGVNIKSGRFLETNFGNKTFCLRNWANRQCRGQISMVSYSEHEKRQT